MQITSSWASSNDSGILFKRMLELHKQEGVASQEYAHMMDAIIAQNQELQVRTTKLDATPCACNTSAASCQCCTAVSQQASAVQTTL